MRPGRGKKKPAQPKVRSAVAISAHFATGAGTHGGGKKQRIRRDRQATRKTIQRQEW